MIRLLLALVLCTSSVIFVKGAQYESALSSFSSKGELLQVEYARKAALRGQPMIAGICSNNKALVCIPTRKHVQKLCDSRLLDKIIQVDKHQYIGFSGLAGDARAVANKARTFCLESRFQLGFLLNPLGLAKYLHRVQYEATLTEGTRPLGIQLLIIGNNIEANQLELILLDPLGELCTCKAVAIGQSSDKITSMLESEFSDNLSCVECARVFTNLLEQTQSLPSQSIDEQSKPSDVNYYVFFVQEGTVVCKRYTSLEALITAEQQNFPTNDDDNSNSNDHTKPKANLKSIRVMKISHFTFFGNIQGS